MWLRLSEPARRAIFTSKQEAIKTGSAQIESEHLLLALLDGSSSSSAQILQKLGITHEELAPVLESSLQQAQQLGSRCSSGVIDKVLVCLFPSYSGQNLQNREPVFSPQVRRSLDWASEEARHTNSVLRRQSDVGTEHLLLGLLRDADSCASQELAKRGIELDQTRLWVLAHLRDTSSS